MKARNLNKRIEIWKTSSESDGFGGNKVTTEQIGTSWAKIESVQPGKSSNLQNFGLIDSNNAVFVTTRKRNDLMYDYNSMFFIYRDKQYTISTAPTNVNFNDAFISFVGSVQSDKSNVTT